MIQYAITPVNGGKWQPVQRRLNSGLFSWLRRCVTVDPDHVCGHFTTPDWWPSRRGAILCE